MYLFRRSNCILRAKLIKTLCTFRQNQAQTHAKTTVDLKDVNLHEKLQKDWWDEFGPIKPLHAMNLVRIPFIRDGLVQYSSDKERNTAPLANKKILDVGCGGGVLSEVGKTGLAKIGATVTGLDAGKDLIELAVQHSKLNPKLQNNLPSYICKTIEDHCKERKNYYDAVVASEVIEHVADKELFVKSCVEALKPGGKIFFTTPTRSRASQILVIYFIEYVMKAIPKGTHRYDKLMTPPELAFLLERSNCHVELTYGLTYNPFSNRWDFIKSQLLFFAMQAKKIA